MIVITGTVDLKPEHGEEGFRLGCEHSARSRSEPGCLAHNCFEDREAPGRMHFFEKWANAEAVRAHFAIPESGAFVRKVSNMAIAPPSIEIYAAEPIGPDAL